MSNDARAIDLAYTHSGTRVRATGSGALGHG